MVTLSDLSEKTTARLYRVQQGDNLHSIAARLYGLPEFWILIYSANAAEIEANGGIRPGQILYLPDP
jgi:nucleoid-associated protein YgaU